MGNKLKTIPQLPPGWGYRERNRLEWWISDGGDPAELIESALAAAGLPAHDLCDPCHSDTSNDAMPDEVTRGRDTPFQPVEFFRRPGHPGTGRTVGASLYVSAAAGAAMIGAPLGAASPAPEVPDVVVIVHEAVPLDGAPPGRPLHGGNPCAEAPCGEAPCGEAPCGEAPHGEAPYGQAPCGEAPCGEAPYGTAPYGTAPHGTVRPGPAPLGGLARSAASPGAAAELAGSLGASSDAGAPAENPLGAAVSGQPDGSDWYVGPWTSSWRPGQHRAAVEEARRAIARGDVYQVNIVGHASAPYLGDPGPALDAVAGLPGAVWAGRLSSAQGRPGGGWAIASGSPECLVTVAGGEVVTRPIKGTGPRTEAGRAALLASTKERAEHVMIVDLARNDLGRIATTGSVRVDELFAVRPWSGLWQAESTVRARLRPGVGVAELLRAVCPGASVTGAPKRAALDVLSALEPVGRGPSMGALGYVSPHGIALGLTIRTVAAVGRGDGSGGTLHLWAGGGITWSSNPDDEVAEAAAKAAPLDAAVRGVGQALYRTSAGRREKTGT